MTTEQTQEAIEKLTEAVTMMKELYEMQQREIDDLRGRVNGLLEDIKELERR